ncbi:MAG: four helix bundle protein [Candidatus Paceibacterota bacterium]|jgi:four helix bundle protein
MITSKIYKFTDLDCWREAHSLVLDIYKITSNFPKSETFGLASQMRRAAVSITSNIAEGFGRTSYKEKHQFYSISRGSLIELENQMIIARDVSYVEKIVYDKICDKIAKVSMILSGLIRSTRKHQND